MQMVWVSTNPPGIFIGQQPSGRSTLFWVRVRPVVRALLRLLRQQTVPRKGRNNKRPCLVHRLGNPSLHSNIGQVLKHFVLPDPGMVPVTYPLMRVRPFSRSPLELFDVFYYS
ncbi:hypothetical protein VTK26DRAFT_239 [Humicola hyalothermophila]